MKTEVIEIHPEFPEIDKILKCAKIIRQGGLVIFPTDTVYGVAADLSNEKAIKRLREVKKRAEDKPFSVLISQRGLVTNYTSSRDPKLYKLIDAFWPGALTIVVPSRTDNETVGIRMPNHGIALKLVQESQCAIAAPSANIEGNPPPKTCAEALKDLDGLVDIAIDGGEAKLGLGSTVVDITKDDPVILREGSVSSDDINKVVGKKTVLFVCTGNSCRSVMAEYLLKDACSSRDDIEVVSAGTGVFIQSTASAETISVLNEKGINATGHISQSISTVLLKKSDLILVMTRGHRQQVLERVPEVENRVYLLREFADLPTSMRPDLDIPDPIGRNHDEYKYCMGLINESILKLKDLV